jgi:tetratricopeptide (TPR) repeat protein/predicted Ser/Thr protein kinase
MEESKTEPQPLPGKATAEVPTREVPANASQSRPSPSPSSPSQNSDLAVDDAYALERGTRVERYILLKPLGQGGMGVVYAAYDPDLDRKVALKLLRPDKQTPEGNTERAWMLREAQAMARISHPNVISVYDTGTFGSQVFVAMEFIQGRTLSTWMRREKHTWQEILHVFLEAGKGLTAAHKARLVHRDFKPSNVLVGDSGRVYVLDFGLARLAQLAEAEEKERFGADEDLPVLTGESIALALPESNLLMGTPQYMPPEQYLGTNVDARADQFSFCAALYWALYRKRPFEPRQVARSAVECSKGTAGTDRSDESWRNLPHTTAAREPPTNSQVPAWVRRTVMRGLSLHPDDRFPSMEALLEALSQEQRRLHRRGALAAAGVLALAAVSGGGYAYQQSRVCAGAPSLVASVWGPEARQKLETSFLATGRPFARETALKVARMLDGYAGQWATMHTQACEATRVRGEQTEELLSMRMVCLDRRRKDLSALTGLLTQADGKVVERAVEAAAALPSLRPCEDIASLAELPALPADPSLRATIERLGGKVAEVKALNDAGRYKAGVELARQLEPEVVASAYMPLQAELRFHLGWLLQQSGEVPEGIHQMEQAFDAAESSRSDRLRVEVLTKLIFTLVNNGHPKEADRWGQVAEAILKRVDGEPPLAIDLMGNLGYVALQQGRYQEAKAAFERAQMMMASTFGPDHPKHAKVSHGLGLVALKTGEHATAIALLSQSLRQTQEAKGEQHPEVATRHTMLASAYRESGQLEQALEHVSKALEVRRATQGPEHPAVATALDELGTSQIALKRYDEAVATFQQALELRRKTLGEEHLDLSYSYDGIGQALLAGGKAAEAVEPLKKALAYKDTEPELLAQAGFALAKALWTVGQEPEQAREAARQAREHYVKLEKPRQAAEISSWLDSRAEAPTPAPKSKPAKQRPTKRKSR